MRERYMASEAINQETVTTVAAVKEISSALPSDATAEQTLGAGLAEEAAKARRKPSRELIDRLAAMKKKDTGQVDSSDRVALLESTIGRKDEEAEKLLEAISGYAEEAEDFLNYEFDNLDANQKILLSDRLQKTLYDIPGFQELFEGASDAQKKEFITDCFKNTEFRLTVREAYESAVKGEVPLDEKTTTCKGLSKEATGGEPLPADRKGWEEMAAKIDRLIEERTRTIAKKEEEVLLSMSNPNVLPPEQSEIQASLLAAQEAVRQTQKKIAEAGIDLKATTNRLSDFARGTDGKPLKDTGGNILASAADRLDKAEAYLRSNSRENYVENKAQADSLKAQIAAQKTRQNSRRRGNDRGGGNNNTDTENKEEGTGAQLAELVRQEAEARAKVAQYEDAETALKELPKEKNEQEKRKISLEADMARESALLAGQQQREAEAALRFQQAVTDVDSSSFHGLGELESELKSLKTDKALVEATLESIGIETGKGLREKFGSIFEDAAKTFMDKKKAEYDQKAIASINEYSEKMVSGAKTERDKLFATTLREKYFLITDGKITGVRSLVAKEDLKKLMELGPEEMARTFLNDIKRKQEAENATAAAAVVAGVGLTEPHPNPLTTEEIEELMKDEAFKTGTIPEITATIFAAELRGEGTLHTSYIKDLGEKLAGKPWAGEAVKRALEMNKPANDIVDALMASENYKKTKGEWVKDVLSHKKTNYFLLLLLLGGPGTALLTFGGYGIWKAMRSGATANEPAAA